MSASKIRGKILMEMWATGKPMTTQELSEKTGLTPSSTMGYLLGLIKAKYVSVPETHHYAITNLGKQALGLPKIDQKLASTILNPVSEEKTFYFYYGINNYSGVYTNSLEAFVDKLQTVDLKSIEFHVPRKDFELWIRSLGDIELAKKLGLLRLKNLSGEALRKALYETVSSRCQELSKLTV
ncbi:MAG: helix-turn-helix domain-containing protein [Candidatus Bathyarchaeota archaeon]|jgi:hypothetical protein